MSSTCPMPLVDTQIHTHAQREREREGGREREASAPNPSSERFGCTAVVAAVGLVSSATRSFVLHLPERKVPCVFMFSGPAQLTCKRRAALLSFPV